MSKSSQSINGSSRNDVSVEDLSAQIDLLKRDLSTLTHTLADFGVSKTHEATDTVKDKASELKAAGRDKAIEAQLHAEDFIRNQPATALGIAAGFGFLVGMFTRSRR